MLQRSIMCAALVAGVFASTASANDDRANAMQIDQGTWAFDTAGATTDGPTHSVRRGDDLESNQTYNDVWFDYMPHQSDTLYVSTCMASGGWVSGDAEITLYELDTETNTIAPLAFNEGDLTAFCQSGGFGQSVSAPVTAGSTYLIRIGTPERDSPDVSGDITLALGCPGNCSGQGTCVNGQCECFGAFFGTNCGCEDESLLLNGLFQYVSVEAKPEFSIHQGSGNALTVEAWVTPTKFGFTAIGYILDSGGTQWELKVGTNPADSSPVFQSAGFIANNVQGGTIGLNEWNHLAATFDPDINEAVLYVNGVEEARGPFNPTTNPDAFMQIGLVGANYYGGNIDEVRVWNYARTPAEIAANLDRPVDPQTPGIEFYVRWDSVDPSTGFTRDMGPDQLDVDLELFAVTETFVPDIADPPCSFDDTTGVPCDGRGSCSCGICVCNNPTDFTNDCRNSPLHGGSSGRCCLPDGSCVTTFEGACDTFGGIYTDGIFCSIFNPCDLSLFCTADFDGNGEVNLGDFGVFGAAFGSVIGDANYNPAADFDNDGDIDLGEFGTFGMDFGRTDCPN